MGGAVELRDSPCGGVGGGNHSCPEPEREGREKITVNTAVKNKASPVTEWLEYSSPFSAASEFAPISGSPLVSGVQTMVSVQTNGQRSHAGCWAAFPAIRFNHHELLLIKIIILNNS